MTPARPRRSRRAVDQAAKGLPAIHYLSFADGAIERAATVDDLARAVTRAIHEHASDCFTRAFTTEGLRTLTADEMRTLLVRMAEQRDSA